MADTAQVAKPAFSFPLAEYAAKRHDIVVRGNLDKMLAGDAWGAHHSVQRHTSEHKLSSGLFSSSAPLILLFEEAPWRGPGW